MYDIYNGRYFVRSIVLKLNKQQAFAFLLLVWILLRCCSLFVAATGTGSDATAHGEEDGEAD